MNPAIRDDLKLVEQPQSFEEELELVALASLEALVLVRISEQLPMELESPLEAERFQLRPLPSLFRLSLSFEQRQFS